MEPSSFVVDRTLRSATLREAGLDQRRALDRIRLEQRVQVLTNSRLHVRQVHVRVAVHLLGQRARDDAKQGRELAAREGGEIRVPVGVLTEEAGQGLDVRALQVCQGDKLRAGERATELNLVMADPPGERLAFDRFGATPEDALEQGRRLAEFLGVPLLDHTCPPGSDG